MQVCGPKNESARAAWHVVPGWKKWLLNHDIEDVLIT
jgi:hypothetical protein